LELLTTIEKAVKLNKRKVVIMAHSMGNIFFHFFCDFGAPFVSPMNHMVVVKSNEVFDNGQ